MESYYYVTGDHSAGQDAEWAIKGRRNGVIMVRKCTLHEADPGSELDENTRGSRRVHSS